MIINSDYNAVKQAHNNTNVKPASVETQKKASTLAADNTDKFDPKSAAFSATYNKETSRKEYTDIDKEGFRAKGFQQMKNDAVRDMVTSQIGGQIKKGGYKPLFPNNPTIMNALKAAEATSEKHDDYWGIEATAERIFTFAKGLAGGDEAKLEKMKDAFLKGFNQAEGMWGKAGGGKLPEISYKTKERVLELFDSYGKELAAKKAGEPAKEAEKKEEKNIYDTKFAQGNKIPITGLDKYGASAQIIKPNGY